MGSNGMNLSTFQMVELSILTMTTVYHGIATYQEKSSLPAPGHILAIGQQKFHYHEQGSGHFTILIDSSLGGAEGYLLIDRLATLGKVVMFDRPGYGWSQQSLKPRTSQQNNLDLQDLLQAAKIQPPYLLIGDSFGSYNLRLFAHQYPEQVVGLVLTDGLHETQMLSLLLRLKLLKLFFAISFVFLSFGAMLGITRMLGTLGLFELIKPELRHCDPNRLRQVKRSFYRASHWLTMAREMISLNTSGQQLQVAHNLGDLPVVNIKAGTFLRLPGPALLWNWLMNPADRVRDQIHLALAQLSTNSQQFSTPTSSHFVWIDDPEMMVTAVRAAIAAGKS
jgi:pimeloyl-ACP methyl ester carboxylesterase